MPTQQLKIIQVVTPALTLRNDVIHREIAEWKEHLATSAQTLLLAE